MSRISGKCSSHPPSQQTVVFGIDDPITLADDFFQTLAVDYRNRSANIFNQFLLGEFLSRQRDAFAAHAEHIGYQVVRHHQLVRVEAVVAQKQPAAELLFNGMQAITNGGLRDLRQERLSEAQHHHLKRICFRKFLFTSFALILKAPPEL